MHNNVDGDIEEKKHRSWFSIGREMSRCGWRLFSALAFMAGVSFFLQMHEIRLDVPELHSISSQYVVAQLSFEFPDEEKTLFLRQQAIHDIGPIYHLDSRELVQWSSAFEEHLIQDQSWRRLDPKMTFEKIYEHGESLEDFLVESRFSDERTLEKIQDLFPVTEPLFPLSFLQEKQGEEFWQLAKEQVFSTGDSQAISAFVIDFFQDHKWSLERDSGLEKRIKEAVKEAVPEQYTLVQAGSFLLEPGEKVTAKHIVQLQSLKHALGDTGVLLSWGGILGAIALSFVITLLIAVYLRMYYVDIFSSLRKVLLLTLICLLTLALAKGAEYVLYHGYAFIDTVHFLLIIPFASLLLSVLLGTRIALFSSIFLCVIVSLGLSIDYDRFLVLNLVAAMCAVMFAKGVHKRKGIFQVCVKVWLCCLPVLFAFHLLEGSVQGVGIVLDAFVSFVFLSGTSVLVVAFLPLLESLFHVMTDMTLMEYMDPNNALLRRLSLEAPGTYQHSLVVGNFAEIMARSIGANDLFCRVAALYHDIGKLFNPHYFTENQLGGFNIHQLLTPLESTHVIISHVAEGEVLARKHRLPQSFIDVIREHHGTTLVYFFYCKQIEQMEGDVSKVNKKLFRYPGPKPHTKESALIMIADTIEAASRSLDEVTEEVVQEMVERLFSEKAMEGQFDECPLTFQELCTVKKTIVRALLVTRHLRIKYPTEGAGKAVAKIIV